MTIAVPSPTRTRAGRRSIEPVLLEAPGQATVPEAGYTEFPVAICPLCRKSNLPHRTTMFSGGARGSEDQKSAYWQIEGDYTRHFGIVLGSRGRGTLKLMRYLAKDDVPELFESVKSHLLKAIGEWGVLGWLTEDDVLTAIRTPPAREDISPPAGPIRGVPEPAEIPEVPTLSQPQAIPAPSKRKAQKPVKKLPVSPLIEALERERQELIALAQEVSRGGSEPEAFKNLATRADAFLIQTRDIFKRPVYPDAELTLDLLLGEDRAGGCVSALIRSRERLGTTVARLAALQSCQRAAGILSEDLTTSVPTAPLASKKGKQELQAPPRQVKVPEFPKFPDVPNIRAIQRMVNFIEQAPDEEAPEEARDAWSDLSRRLYETLETWQENREELSRNTENEERASLYENQASAIEEAKDALDDADAPDWAGALDGLSNYET